MQRGENDLPIGFQAHCRAASEGDAMSIELKQAAQQAVEALEWYVENDDVVESMPGNEFWVGGKREAEKAIQELRTAIQQAEAQQPDNAACGSVQKRHQAQQPATGEPVYWEWRHLSTHPDTVDFGKWSEWKRVEARSAIHTIEDALAEFRAYIAQGYKYELRALYDHPAPSVPDEKPLPDLMMASYHEAIGWNACRAAMLAAK